jgi:hypothetical protein
MEFKDETYKNDLGSFFPMPVRIIAFFIAIAGLAALFSGSAATIVSLLLLPVSVALMFAKKVFEINFVEKQYREANSIFGMVSGAWKPLPAFEYVSVFKCRISSTMNSRASQSTIKVEEIQVNLVYPKNKKLEAANFERSEKAFAAAQYFSQKLDLKILDATQKPFVWLD